MADEETDSVADDGVEKPRYRPSPDLTRCGLNPAVRAGEVLNFVAWREAAETGALVGTCRACGGCLVADPPVPPREGDRAGPTWFVAHCLTCRHEVASPGGRLVDRHSHTQTTNKGSWHKRG